MLKNKPYIFILLPIFLANCSKEVQQGRNRLELLSVRESGINFTNEITHAKFNIMEYVNLYNGSGVGIGDFNNDGFEDVFFGGNLVSSRLYINQGITGKISFRDMTSVSGVQTNQWVNGVTVVDINQDGWLDIYCSVSGGSSEAQRKNLLFINLGTDKEGTVHFSEQGGAYGLDVATHSIQSTFFDYDGDGDLDVFIITNPPIGYLDAAANEIVPIRNPGDPERHDRLLRNESVGADGYIKFTDVSSDAGITLEGFSLGVAVHDFNNDGRPDVYVANDYVTNDILYINNGDGTFSDRIRDYVTHTSYSSMGIDIADINNDGLMDFMVMDMLPENDKDTKMMYAAINHTGHGLMQKLGYVDQYNRNMLQLNNGTQGNSPRKFSEIGRFSGVEKTHWSWSVLMPDLDLDGWRDIFITNGFLKDVNDLDFINYEQGNPFKQYTFDGEAYLESLKNVKGIYLPNYVYRNRGDLTFENIGNSWGVNQSSFSNGAAYADFDNDGDLDLVVNNINEPASIYENHSVGQAGEDFNFLQIELRGDKPNLQALGAKIDFRTSQGLQTYENYVNRGYLSSVSPIAHFGLGKDSIVSKIDITWPDGKVQSLENIKCNQKVTVHKSVGAKKKENTSFKTNGLFSSIALETIDYTHGELPYNDFDDQRLLPSKLSRLGPGIAVGDIDQDGLDDFYVGGSNGSLGRLFYQNKTGQFQGTQVEDTIWYEDQGSLLFDADNDGDLDIYFVSGGVERGENSRFYSDRLLINKGNRKFQKSEQQFPRENGSCVTGADYDRDGDIDLFVGGASKPGNFPLAAKSMLLKNETKAVDNPILSEVENAQIAELGIVRSAIWSDYDNDGWPDLLVVGEFMPLTVFRNIQGKLVRLDDQLLPKEVGLWNSITAADLDRDGHMDYVLGNAGLNSRLRPSKEQPITLYAGDFDDNGSVDPIMTKISMGKEVPVHLRDDMFKQLVHLKKRMPKYSHYAEARITDIISKEEMENAKKFYWNYTESVCYMNDGKGGFKLKPLPLRAQVAPIYGTLVDDFNGDGIPDILAVGNSHSTEVFNGHQNASVGMLILGKGNGDFDFVPPQFTDFYVLGDTKALARLQSKDGSFLNLVSVNNDSLRIFMENNKELDVIRLQPPDCYAKIKFLSGEIEFREFYLGSGYYSQNTRTLKITRAMEEIKIFDGQGNARIAYQSKSNK